MLRRQSLVHAAALLLTTVFSCAPAVAGDGFPPFGAWAYGSRGFGWTGHQPLTHGYRGHFHGLHHHSHFRRGWYATYRVAPVLPLAYTYCPPVVYRPAVVLFRPPVINYWSNYGVGLSGCWPLVSHTRTWGYTFQNPVDPCYPGYPAASYSVSHVTGYTNLGDVVAASFDDSAADHSTADDSTPAHYIVMNDQLASGQIPAQAVPTELLEVADRILQLGGYREAATAYARLTARFGSNPQLLARRFVAQVMSQDFAQATVVAASARLLQQPIERHLIPSESLGSLGITPATAATLSEKLAEYAVSRPEDAASLAAVAYWLALTGRDETSALFLARVDQLENVTRETLPESLSLQRPFAARRDASPGSSKTTFTAVK